MALTIAVGFVVDDAIVMLENIYRHLEEGLTPYEAALKGAGEIGFTIISISVSLVAVFIPLLLMGGIIGRLFREFAVTVTMTIAVSAIVSLTLTPMMAARILRSSKGEQGRFYRASERVFERLIAFYGRTLRVVLRHERATLFVVAGTLGLTVLLYTIIPKGLFPIQDTGVIQAISQASPTIGVAAMAEKQQEIASAVLDDPAVASLSSFIGADGTNVTLNSGRMSINLKPLAERSIGAPELIRRLQGRVRSVQGIQLYMQPVQNITVDNRVSRTQYQYSLEDADADELEVWTGRFVERLRALPQLEDIATDEQPGGLATFLDIDRVTASRFGIAPSTIDNTLYNAFGQRQINTMYTQVNQYHVVLEADPEFQRDPRSLGDLYIQANASAGLSGAGASSSFQSAASVSAGSNALTTAVAYDPTPLVLTAPAGALAPAGSSSASSAAPPVALTTSSTTSNAVPLKAFARTKKTTEPLVISHQGQFPSVTVSFNLAHGASLGDAISAIDGAQRDLHAPASLGASFQGTAAAFTRSLGSEPVLILAALVTVYIVLGILYESFVHPITILSTLPSAGVGALLALMFFRSDLNVVAIIGIVLLIGIVKKNGIMMVDFALEAERKDGKSASDAIYEASLLRFRPIMMTTMAALLGGLPLAMGTGFGSELRRPLGISIVGGLLLSQVLTLYTTPVIYVFFDGIGRRLSHLRRARKSRP
jgi:multidrug efflux pump